MKSYAFGFLSVSKVSLAHFFLERSVQVPLYGIPLGCVDNWLREKLPETERTPMVTIADGSGDSVCGEMDFLDAGVLVKQISGGIIQTLLVDGIANGLQSFPASHSRRFRAPRVGGSLISD